MVIRLNSAKIRKMMNLLNWTFSDLARESGLKSRQSAFYHVKNRTIKGAILFSKPLSIEPKDLLETVWSGGTIV